MPPQYLSADNVEHNPNAYTLADSALPRTTQNIKHKYHTRDERDTSERLHGSPQFEGSTV